MQHAGPLPRAAATHPSTSMKRFFLPLLALLPLCAVPLAAQEPAPGEAGWGGARAQEIVARAQARRAETATDTGLVSYQADARGYVYFFLDRGDTDERTLVKTDQVALDVFWRAPDLTKQRIVGLRDEKKLPTRIQYHIDHLSVVQDNFGDRIRLGDGDEVRDVLHPAAPGAERFYEYRLTDSLSISLPGAAEPVRVYEVQVRPRDFGQPAFLGSVFVERARGDLVRMDFTFTPSSYVDRYLDYINVSLDNGLWKGRFWLPNQQRVEIRRALPELDFPAGGVIRGTMRVGNYRFNEPLPPGLFRGPPVVAVAQSERESFPFEQELYEELREEGAAADPDLDAIRREAVRLARARLLSGIPGVRPDVGSVSELLRYNRAEGLFLGLGVGTRPTERLALGLQGGWAFGAAHPVVAGDAAWNVPAARWSAAGYWNAPRELGVLGPAASGALNTLSTLLAGRDYTDLFYARGAEVSAERSVGPGWTLAGGARAEAQRSAERESGVSLFGDLRPVVPIDEGTALIGRLALRRETPAEAARAWGAEAVLEGGTLDSDFAIEGSEDPRWLRPRVAVNWTRRWAPGDAALELRGAGGMGFGTLPRQEIFLLGGRGTLPGFGFRAFAGDRFALAGATLSADLRSPWLRGRLRGALGWTGVGEAGERASLLLPGTADADAVRGSVGVGAGLFYDVLRVDLMRGIGPGGRWEVVVETRPAFWDFL